MIIFNWKHSVLSSCTVIICIVYIYHTAPCFKLRVSSSGNVQLKNKAVSQHVIFLSGWQIVTLVNNETVLKLLSPITVVSTYWTCRLNYWILISGAVTML
jgi:hypothetical protein